MTEILHLDLHREILRADCGGNEADGVSQPHAFNRVFRVDLGPLLYPVRFYRFVQQP